MATTTRREHDFDPCKPALHATAHSARLTQPVGLCVTEMAPALTVLVEDRKVPSKRLQSWAQHIRIFRQGSKG
jgi:hypothetical protein